MASNFDATRYADDVPLKRPDNPDEICAFRTEYELLAALVVDDVIRLAKIPADCVIQSITLYSDDVDTNGTPLVVYDVGVEGGDIDVFIDGSTIGQTGGIENMNAIKAVEHAAITTEWTLALQAVTAPATGVVGTIIADVTYRRARLDEY